MCPEPPEIKYFICFSVKIAKIFFFSEAYGNFMVTGRYSRLLRSGTDEMTHFHTKRNRRRRAL